MTDVALDLVGELAGPLADALRGLGLTVSEAAEPDSHALVAVREAPPAVAGAPDRWGAVFLVAGATPAYTEAQALAAGADGLAVWGETPVAVMAARVAALVRRRAHDLDLHPLTRLPGGAALRAALLRELPRRGSLALTGYDIGHFKAFNDHYGFAPGDDVLRFLGDVLVATAGDRGRVYHLGGDDFFVLSSPQDCDELAAAALARFDAEITGYYQAADLARGGVPGLDRQSGEPRCYPLMSLTAATACNEAPDMEHPGQLAQVIAELKAYARRTPGSRHVRDRRLVHDVARSLARRPDATAGAGDRGLS